MPKNVLMSDKIYEKSNHPYFKMQNIFPERFAQVWETNKKHCLYNQTFMIQQNLVCLKM